MQIRFHSGAATTAPADLLLVGVFSEGWERGTAVKAIDKALKGALLAAARDEDFKGGSKQKVVMNTGGKLRSKRVALIGLGSGKSVEAAALVAMAGSATRIANASGAGNAILIAPKTEQKPEEYLRLLARGLELGGYRYERYRSKKGRAATLRRVGVAIEGVAKAPAKAAAAIRTGAVMAESIALARDLVNEPGLDLYPESFAKRAAGISRRVGLTCKIFGPAQLEKMGMRLLLGVGAGSARKPRLVHMSYRPKAAAKNAKPIVLVGKGVTFDSGGLCLKSPGNMGDMKVDMAGAAAVMGAMNAVAKLKPKTPVHGILTLAENMPSGTAIRLGDVIRSAAGTTVEINNTDAEGRLVLADALHYACGLKPKRIIDLATLTGACVVALGPFTVGLFASDDALADRLLESADRCGESFWRMPLLPALKTQLDSDVADTKNTGDRAGGAITASLFLEKFVGKIPWAHLDIAGAATSSKSSGATAKGGTGVAVATLTELLC